jgi:ABC-type transport system substrate-binding protein
MARMIAEMWKKIGVNASVVVMDSSEFMDLRKKSGLACYAATWIADYNDPDNFIYTFFGDREKTNGRSLCYPDEDIMARVRKARTITDPDKRIAEYRALEKKIVQEDAAWIPLFSREKIYVTTERLDGFTTAWSGTFYEKLPDMSIKEPE